jgi:hypothetical protein
MGVQRRAKAVYKAHRTESPGARAAALAQARLEGATLDPAHRSALHGIEAPMAATPTTWC